MWIIRLLTIEHIFSPCPSLCHVPKRSFLNQALVACCRGLTAALLNYANYAVYGPIVYKNYRPHMALLQTTITLSVCERLYYAMMISNKKGFWEALCDALVSYVNVHGCSVFL